jgi:hypothetical protein
MLKVISRLIIISLTWFVFACDDPPPIQAGDNAGNDEPYMPPMNGGTPVGGTPVAGVDVQPTPIEVPANCNEYEQNGAVYNCQLVEQSRCTPEGSRDPGLFACAECYQQNGFPGLANQPCIEICNDGIDNDLDNLADCDDNDCMYNPNYCEVPMGGNVPPPPPPPEEADGCMFCHNGSDQNDYAGNGITNPHPFPPADKIPCTGCHGGDPAGRTKEQAHVPVHPKIGDRLNQINDPAAFFNRVTLAGIDKLQPSTYPSNGNGGCENDVCTNLDYLQFVNPGDLRVVSQGNGCGTCHGNEHGAWVAGSVIGTTNGFFSGTRYMVGAENRIPDYRGYEDEGNALSGSAPRDVENKTYNPVARIIGEVGRLVEQPEIAQYNGVMFNNNSYNAANLPNDIDNTDINRPNRVSQDSYLEKLIDEQVSITCGNCHLYSAGNNDRYGDFRSSGCTSCHMQYSLDGRSRSTDPNVPKNEPANPDAIAPGERAHISDHIIRNVSKNVNGVIVRGITDNACVGCHQGSNRTVLQFWGIRLDQNKDLTNNLQYPANPDTFVNTENDRRLFDPAVNNNTFNGRDFEQYILEEDYDGDGLDDTPPDVHYENGMGCIDCHSSRDLHGGTAGDVASSGKIMSRQDQATAITCESCHGTIEDYAPTVDCTDYQKQNAQCVTDRFNNPLRHVTRDAEGNFWLISRVYGDRHYVPQTRDLVYNNQKDHPETGQLLYSPKAAYAMGRIGDQVGSGPIQNDPNLYSQGFSHTDDLDCSSCHASWTNNCIGCHLANAYDANPNNYFFSNITGERILLAEDEATFVYQNPVFTYLGINSKGYVTQISPAEKMFYRYKDLNGNFSDTFAFSDRLGEGNNPARLGRNDFPALAMNQMAPHSIRGRLEPNGGNEGLRYCVTCHLNTDSINNQGDDYIAFRDAYLNNDFDTVFNDFQDTLIADIGLNTGNQNNSPFFVHMVAGLGTGLFLFDANGCPINPIDERDDRADPNATNKCNNQSPQDNFNNDNFDNVAFDLDRIVEVDGTSNSSSIHPNIQQRGPRRQGNNYMMSGPLNSTLLYKLADPVEGIILDSWLDADGNAQGNLDL